MTITVTSIEQVDDELVAATAEEVRDLLLEMHDNLDTRRGPMHDLVLYPSSMLSAARRTEMELLRQSSTLKLINENPTLADDDTVDATMSNYRLSRRAGQTATGTVTIVVSQLSTVSVPSGGLFEANGQQFQSTQAYLGRITEEVVQEDTDRLLRPLGDGTYGFNITVAAVEIGQAGMLIKDTLLTPQFSILNFVKAFASSDFHGGRNEETNAELAARALAGSSAQTASNRMTMTAAILGQEQFADVLNQSIIGFGDAEQIRDQHSIIPMSYGGRVDWYFRTARLPTRVTDTVEAILMEKTPDNRGIWQVVVTRDMHPGYYDITSIVPAGLVDYAGGFPIVSEIRGFDLTDIPGELLPDLLTAEEAAFSRFQTCVIRFKDTETDTTDMTANETTGMYDVTFRGMLQIADLQTYVSDRGFRYRGGDLLCRAAIACSVSISFTVEGPADHVLPDANLIAEDLAEYINTLGFAGRLYASALADIIKNWLGSELHVGAIDMFGQVLRPDGVTRSIRSTEYIEIPYEPTHMVSGRTVIFICDPQDIAISAATISVPQVL